MSFFEFLLAFDGGCNVYLYFYAPGRDQAWEQVWTKAIEQGHDPHKIRCIELNWEEKAQ